MHETTVRRDQASRLRQMAGGENHKSLVVYPRVITVTSGKGGVGKSTIALNLALTLCGPERRILLVDADANLGNLDVLLGIAPEFRLGDVLRGEKTVDDVLVSPAPGLHLLPGNSGDVGYPASRPGTLVTDFRSPERGIHDVIIDTSAGLSPDIVGYAVHADEVLLVTSPEPTAVMDAYAMIKVVHRTKPDVRIAVVMNAVRVRSEADDAAAKLAVATGRFLSRTFNYLGAVPYDEKVIMCVGRQAALVREFPASPASRSIQAMARHFVRHSE